MNDKILIIEDDSDIADLIRVNLLEIVPTIEHCSDGKQGLNAALSQDFDVVILDVMLPSMNGLDICRTLRENKPEQAIIMLTAKNSETDHVLGLELGADDYMTKPFSVRELQARVRSQLRKAHILKSKQGGTEAATDSLLRFGELQINQSSREVLYDGKNIDLTATEFDLLFYMASKPNQVFNRTQLLEAVWGYQHSGYEHTVNSHINRLRSKLEKDATAPKIVQTVWGVGYRFSTQGTIA
ncbi:response regulator transcription factor [Alteromonas sp. a30]|uniref:response regulator transcription factor n=1 Tax=Alteromonas sp. a30 TaxID=2730917 RepID=UPI00227EBEAD|nr:response regulator transcription factor [Alteromonas sp. a30]MCY7296932.1 response regulator transcription factor [Alteromonas sp. a30]